ncbi:MAG: hypothetical protein ACI4BG_08930, partial [Prevotella sp.]
VELARKATPSLQNHSSGRNVSLDMTIFLPLYIQTYHHSTENIRCAFFVGFHPEVKRKIATFAEDKQEASLTRRARMCEGGLRPPTTKTVDISYIEDNRREI